MPGSPPQVRGKPSCRQVRHIYFRITPAGAGKTFIRWGLRHTIRDHPRRCGENSAQNRNQPSKTGSPPQVRGKRGLAAEPATVCGITPAGAGKTIRSVYVGNCALDHPRRCGENCLNAAWSKARKGSPPQVRGKRHVLLDGEEVGRITPAGAGKTIQKANALR